MHGNDKTRLACDPLAHRLLPAVASWPVRFDRCAQIAMPGAVIDDPSVARPENRRTVKLGAITLDAVANQAAEDRKLLFLPANLPAGIEAADPVPGVRNAPIRSHSASGCSRRVMEAACLLR